MKQLKNVFAILTLLFTALFIACNDGNGGDDKDSGASGDSVVCTYYMKDDTSVYYVFYGDGSVEYYSKGELQYKRGVLRYKGNPKSEGTVDITVNTGTLLVTFKVSYVNKVLVPTVELVPGFPVEYTLTLDGENNNGENSGTDKENTEGSGGNGENDNTENVNTCKWVLDTDHSIYFIFYPDNTVEYYSYDSLEYDRSTLNYEGSPTEAGTVTIKVNTGVPLFTFTVTKNGSSVTATENNMGLTYTMAGDSSNNGESGDDENGGTETPEEPSIDIDESPLMFMGFDNVVTIEKGTDITGITNTIYSLTSDTTLKFKGGINSITLTTIAAAMGTNDSVKIALDFSEATGITEWTNKLAGQKTLYAISLPGTVTSVQDGAFTGCTNLKAITVPCSITAYPSTPSSTIVNFVGTLEDWLKSSVVLPIGQILYLNGAKLELTGTVSIPDTVTMIKDNAFWQCSNITGINLPRGVTRIGAHAFSGCSSLNNITIPDSVTKIGEGAFSGCSSLSKIRIPNSVTIIEKNAFFNCTELRELIIEDGETTLTFLNSGTYANSVNEALYNCPLETLYLGRSFDCYGASPFAYKTTLISLEIGKNTKTIRETAFVSCSGLTSITIPNTVESIGVQAFRKCTALKEVIIEDGDTELNFLGDNSIVVFTECPLETVYLGRNLNFESHCSPFSEQDNLASVEIGDKVTSIEALAFYGCSGVTNVYYKGTLANWMNISFSAYSNPCIYGADLYINGTKISDLEIPAETTNIGAFTFCGCKSITRVIIPDWVTSIGAYAFYNCSGLPNLINIPSNVTSIGKYAFSKCSGLTQLYIEEGETPLKLENSVFSNSPLESIDLRRDIEFDGESPFRAMTTLTSLYIDGDATNIAAGAFSECTELTGAAIYGNVSSIGEKAFYGCKKLSSVVLSYNIATIGAYAFAGCRKLETVSWDTRETHVPLTIGDYAFSTCESLSQWLILQDTNVTAIGNYAFYNCDFSGILIPVTVTRIGDSAFEKCSILDNGGVVYYTGSESQWQEISIGSNNTELTTATIWYNYTGD